MVVCRCIRVRERPERMIHFFLFNSTSQVQRNSDDKTKDKDRARKSQQTIQESVANASKYKHDSKEKQTKEKAIARWIERTGLPVTTIVDEDFVEMMETMDKRLTVPKRTKDGNVIDNEYQGQREKLRKKLAAAWRVSVGFDL